MGRVARRGRRAIDAAESAWRSSAGSWLSIRLDCSSRSLSRLQISSSPSKLLYSAFLRLPHRRRPYSGRPKRAVVPRIASRRSRRRDSEDQPTIPTVSTPARTARVDATSRRLVGHQIARFNVGWRDHGDARAVHRKAYGRAQPPCPRIPPRGLMVNTTASSLRPSKKSAT